MVNKDPRIDAYIAKAAPFARPVLNHLRNIIHATCADVTETMKWSFPHFVYKGSILCSMAAFKQHCSFSFFKASLMNDAEGILTTIGKTSMGNFGQIKKLADLPRDKILKDYLKQAANLNEAGVKLPRIRIKNTSELEVPDYFMKVLKKNKNAMIGFEAFSPSHKKEYIEWITDAKTEITRDKRIATAVEWIEEGKSRNWKYVRQRQKMRSSTSDEQHIKNPQPNARDF